VRAAATATAVTFFAISGAQIYSPYVGESERFIRETFKQARLAAPAILFLDEVDALVGKRAIGTSGGSSSGVQERVSGKRRKFLWYTNSPNYRY
jgi:ATP-dependent 26S proteasome regulatory subunit